ncbi:hypothetical protein WICMUC_000607 [Wickerhamomyces mucosus]|uniref:Phosphatidic acid phosphatase type 2/haloperoxidase domain-containing protein n=1 Tax=Wickerhamomyces mucosus TaxID=1378264 RepID=A0A9P8TIB1_9ASCO|nr:hypothetical protein WICMUC_000607 [Wickerhamomyces mucosus]
MVTQLHYTPIPFDDTYVLYNAEDPISLISVFFTLLPIGILIFYLSWFITSREIEPVIMAGGQVINDILNNIIKNNIKQDRPFKFDGFQTNSLRSGYGMPSAHSQFMGYFASFLILRLWLQWKGLSSCRKFSSTVVLFIVGFLVMFSRVYLHYHSIEQVLVGLSIGTSLGVTYFFAVSIARSIGLINWIIEWPFVKWLHVKDSVYFDSLNLQEEKIAWRKRLNKSLKKDL